MRNLLARLAVAAIRVYQTAVSPMFPSSCRFLPTCSSYAVEAYQTHGFMGGSWRSARRICRCHPWHPGGHDPVDPR